MSAYPLSSPSETFEDHGDGTVTDRRARLMWMRCSLGQRWEQGACRGAPLEIDWPAAGEAAAVLNRSGAYFYNDWRVPRIDEMAMIAERQCNSPRINLAVFPGTPAGWYWTASPRPTSNDDSAVLSFSFAADGMRVDSPSESRHVRLVRHAD